MSTANAPIECIVLSNDKNPIQITMEEAPHALTDEQKQVIQFIYEKARRATESVLQDSKIDPTIKITQTIAQIIKIVEYAKINDKKIAGSSKKGIVIELGRLLIKQVIQDDTVKQMILPIYDLVAEQTLEVMIDVSHVVNTKVREATSSCFDWLCCRS